jgi:hypothetical protein
MFIQLFILTVSISTPDLSPPFYITSKFRIGYWLIAESSIVQEDLIILVPPIQHRYGHAWCTLPLPTGEWSIDFTLAIDEGTGGGGFAIWLIDEFAITGAFYGGPSAFSGAAITGSVFADDSGAPFLNLDVIQATMNESHDVFNETHLPDAAFPLTPTPFTLKLTVNTTFLTITRLFPANTVPLVSKPLCVNLSNAWIGISAMCDTFTSRIDLLSAKFDTTGYMAAKLRQSSQFQHISDHPPRIEPRHTLFRNPCFELMTIESQHRQKQNGSVHNLEKTSDDVLGIIREFADVVPDVTTYGQLVRFVKKTVETFAVGWHRRTLRIIERAGETRSILSSAFNQTQALVELFNSSVGEMLNKTDAKITRLNDWLDHDKSGRVLVGDLGETPVWIVAMECVTVAEFVAVAVLWARQSVVRRRFVQDRPS